MVEKIKRTAPAGMELKGKHPKVLSNMESIPKDCLKCHGADSAEAPPFARLVHVVHLAGGQRNYFLMAYQGQCTHCHKLDQKTGVWSMPSAKEK
ncbi:hypothetical protein ACFL59_08115 [Planctomycetota bacterium]